MNAKTCNSYSEFIPKPQKPNIFKGNDIEMLRNIKVTRVKRLTKLIEAIYVPPKSPPWYLETVAELTKRIGGLDKQILRSRLDENPIF